MLQKALLYLSTRSKTIRRWLNPTFHLDEHITLAELWAGAEPILVPPSTIALVAETSKPIPKSLLKQAATSHEKWEFCTTFVCRDNRACLFPESCAVSCHVEPDGICTSWLCPHINPCPRK
jgi:hypothetical protein